MPLAPSPALDSHSAGGHHPGRWPPPRSALPECLHDTGRFEGTRGHRRERQWPRNWLTRRWLSPEVARHQWVTDTVFKGSSPVDPAI